MFTGGKAYLLPTVSLSARTPSVGSGQRPGWTESCVCPDNCSALNPHPQRHKGRLGQPRCTLSKRDIIYELLTLHSQYISAILRRVREEEGARPLRLRQLSILELTSGLCRSKTWREQEGELSSLPHTFRLENKSPGMFSCQLGL